MAASGFQHLTLDEQRSLFRTHEARLGVTETANLLYMRAFAGASPDQAFVREPLDDCQWGRSSNC